jgi:FG-GAP repeat
MSTQDEGATMTAWISRLQPSPDLGVAVGPAATHRAVVSRRALVAVAIVCLVLGVMFHQSLGSPSRPPAPGVGSHAASREGLLSLPVAAQGSVSAALGHDQAAYRIEGLVANNPAQRLSARFGRSGVAIASGSTRFAISLKAFGRESAPRTLSAVSPVVSADRVSYAHGSLREWWTNGPLGLEQGFDLARRPAGAGALTLSLTVPVSAHLDHGTLLLPGGLRYAGVHATDASGRALPAWLQMRGGRVLVRVNDRGAHYPVRVDPFVQQAELTAGDGVGGDEFGYSIAVSGNTVVVGAPEHKVGANAQQGAVYVFTMGAGGWANATQTAELTDSAGAAGAELGYSVAISGNTIAAGEPAGTELLHDSNPTHSQGTVDVFTTTGAWTSTGTPNAQLTESSETDVLGGELGWSVAISGKTIVAGAPFDGTHGDPEGVAYVFVEPGGGWSGSHTQAAELTESNPSGEDHFGASVAISGGTVVAGANFFVGDRAQGAAFVFTEPGGGWSGTRTQNAVLKASEPNLAGGDGLGLSVGVSGNTVVAGAFNHKVGQESGQGTAYVFAMPDGGWKDMTQTAELTTGEPLEGNALGFSVAISGSTVVAGAPSHQVGQDSDQGIVYVFTEPAGGWVNAAQTEALTASDGTPSDNLGYSVAISGSTIASGAYRHVAGSDTADLGAAYVFGPGSAPSGGSTGGSGNTGKGTTGGITPTGPTPPPNAHVVFVSGGGGKLTVTLSCSAGGAACSPFSLQATVNEHLKGGKITALTAGDKKKKAHATTKRVVVASGGVTLAAGATKVLTLTLNSTGQALLSKFGKLTTIVTVGSGGKLIDTTTVTVQKTKPKKKRKK